MTDKEFCKLYNAYYGDNMTKPEQLTNQRFNGRELKEFVAFCAKHDYDNPGHWHNNCRDEIKNGMSEIERRKAADSFGRNWANIISGLGDQ